MGTDNSGVGGLIQGGEKNTPRHLMLRKPETKVCVSAGLMGPLARIQTLLT